MYLHPRRARPRGPAVNVDEDPLPDVVLEVDHTTDVRRWKLGMYMEWGFPEIWVLVPWQESVRAPGLTIHVRDGAGYRVSRESLAFPGWRSEENPPRADRGADIGGGVAGPWSGWGGRWARAKAPGRRTTRSPAR